MWDHHDFANSDWLQMEMESHGWISDAHTYTHEFRLQCDRNEITIWFWSMNRCEIRTIPVHQQCTHTNCELGWNSISASVVSNFSMGKLLFTAVNAYILCAHSVPLEWPFKRSLEKRHFGYFETFTKVQFPFLEQSLMNCDSFFSVNRRFLWLNRTKSKTKYNTRRYEQSNSLSFHTKSNIKRSLPTYVVKAKALNSAFIM